MNRPQDLALFATEYNHTLLRGGKFDIILSYEEIEQRQVRTNNSCTPLKFIMRSDLNPPSFS